VSSGTTNILKMGKITPVPCLCCAAARVECLAAKQKIKKREKNYAASPTRDKHKGLRLVFLIYTIRVLVGDALIVILHNVNIIDC
jgi:hypothetical protein